MLPHARSRRSVILIKFILLAVLSGARAASVQAQYVVVTPESYSISAHTNASSQVANFQVTNSAFIDWVAFYCEPSGSVTSCDVDGGAHFQGTVSVVVFFSTGSEGPGAVSLRAVSSFDEDTGGTEVTVGIPQLQITPKGGAVTVNAQTTGHSAVFTLTNTGTGAGSFSLWCSTSGPVYGCSPGSGSVNIAAGSSTQVSVAFATSSEGQGGVSLSGTGTGTNDTGSYNVAVVGIPAVGISPQGGTTAAPAQTNGHTVQFTLSNIGTGAATFNYSCTYSGTVTGCSPTAGSALLTAGGSTSVNVTFNAGAEGSGSVGLAANGPGTNGSGSYTVSITGTPHVQVVSPGSSGSIPVNSGGNVASFTLNNIGTGTATFNYGCSYNGTVTGCTPASGAVILGPGGSMAVPVTYSAGAEGPGTVGLSATGPGTSDSGSYSVSVVGSPAIHVTAPTGSASVPANSSNHTAAFTLANNGTGASTFSYACTRTGTVADCAPLSGSVYLGAGQSTSVTVTYSVGPAGPGTVGLAANGPGATHSASYGVDVEPPPGRQPHVGPRGALTWAPAGSSGRTATFIVTNTDAAVRSVTLSCVADGTRVLQQNCGTSPGTVSLQPDSSQQVTVTYSTGTAGRGWLELRGNGTSIGWYTVSVNAMSGGAPATVDPTPNAPTVERQLCLNISLGEGASAECGDLRVVHPLPPTMTFNKLRRPVLTYNSQHAKPYPHIYADITLAAATASVDVVLVVNGTVRQTKTWNAWTAGQTRRIAIGFDAGSDSTGIYPYQLQVTTSSGVTTAYGEAAIVNRSSSYFGAGWWLAGLEEVRTLGNGDLLWVGGDGSARRYRSLAQGVWVAPSATRPDTIRAEGSGYARLLPAGSRVVFDGSGRHVATVPRLGAAHQTSFAHQNGRLATISLPTPGASAEYTLNYSGGVLSSVTAPGSRVTTVTSSGGRTTGLQDPGLSAVQFSYDGDSRLQTRTNRVGAVRAFAYDVARKLAADTLRMPAPDTNIINRIRSLEVQLAGPTSVAPQDLYVLLDGPRLDVGDTTRFHLDRYGAPARIMNAVNDSTVMTRGDLRFPALVTQIRHPNGFTEQAFYTPRGNLRTQVQVAPFEGGDAVTRFEYADTLWLDFVTRATQPEGDFMEFGYDPGTGNRVWQQDGGGAAARVEFRYYTGGNGSGLVRATKVPLMSADSLTYDPLGNLLGSRTPLGFWTWAYKDGIGRDTLISRPIDVAGSYRQLDRIVYDQAGRDTLRITIGPAMLVGGMSPAGDTLRVRQVYDQESRLTRVDRRSLPDINNIGWMPIEWTYDNAGRMIEEIHPQNMKDLFQYDPAGNLRRIIPRAGWHVNMEYDVLNQLRRRSTTEDTARFTYTNTGQLASATNRYARVTRQYYPAGAIRLDTLRIQETTLVPLDTLWTGYTRHVFGLRYTYDLNGRRTGLKHPGSIAPSGGNVRDSVSYGYNAQHGGLAWIEGLGSSSRFDFTYNDARQLEMIAYPAGVQELLYYDGDGRLRKRQTAAPPGGAYASQVQLAADSIVRDARGKMTFVQGLQGQNTTIYNGSGKLVGVSHTRSPYSSEVYHTDALGNHFTRSRHESAQGHIMGEYQYETATGRLLRILPSDTILAADSSWYWHDAKGRQTGTRLVGKHVPNSLWPYQGPERLQRQVETVSIYDDNDRLIEHNRMTNQLAGAGMNQREYYRYDALGRRVWRQAMNGWRLPGMVRDTICTRSIPSSDCMSFVERIVWDGDQVLYEIRAPSEPGDPVSVLESNSSTGQPLFFGRVAYTHGAGIDQPVEVLRLDLPGTPYPVVPHADWRGTSSSLTWADAAVHQTCGPITDQAHWGPCPEIGLTTSVSAFLESSCPTCADTGPPSWWGNLLRNQQDASGLLYRRNRYYDPAQGRFTQEDPIGLAGGLNLYGYAGGDPVNFSDPFGLCKNKNEEADSKCPPGVVKTTVRTNGGSFGSATTVTNEYAPLSQEQVEHVINEKRAKERMGDNIFATTVGIVAWRLGLRPAPSIAAGFGIGALGTNSTWEYMPHVGDQITTTVTTMPWASTNQQSFVVRRADGSILTLSGSPWEP